MISLISLSYIAAGVLSIFIGVRLSLLYDDFRRDGLRHFIGFYILLGFFWLLLSSPGFILYSETAIASVLVTAHFFFFSAYLLLSYVPKIFYAQSKTTLALMVVLLLGFLIYISVVVSQTPLPVLSGSGWLQTWQLVLPEPLRLLIGVLVLLTTFNIASAFVAIAFSRDSTTVDKRSAIYIAMSFSVLGIALLLFYVSTTAIALFVSMIVAIASLVLGVHGITVLVERGRIVIQ